MENGHALLTCSLINTTQAMKQVTNEWIKIRFDWIMNILPSWLLKPSWKVYPTLKVRGPQAPIMEPRSPPASWLRKLQLQAAGEYFTPPICPPGGLHLQADWISHKSLIVVTTAIRHVFCRMPIPKPKAEGTFSAARLSWLSWVVNQPHLKSFPI